MSIENFLSPKTFGRWTFIGNNPKIMELASKQRAYVSAWRHACPRPDMVIKYYGQAWLKRQDNPELISEEDIEKHGIELTRMRYDDCDFTYGLIISEVEKFGESKKQLLYELTCSVKRHLPEEPMGVHEEGRVPASHEKYMSPLSKLVGYALPRVLIEQFGLHEEFGRKTHRDQERYLRGLKLLNKSIRKSHSAVELLARLAEEVTQADAEPEMVLSHLLEPGIEQEENNHSEFTEVKRALQKYAPNLCNDYAS